MKLIQNMGKKDLYIVYQEKNRIGYQWTRIWNRVFGFKWCMASYKYIKTPDIIRKLLRILIFKSLNGRRLKNSKLGQN